MASTTTTSAKGKGRGARKSSLVAAQEAETGVVGTQDDASDPLSSTFDPTRLKVAELRSLLLQHDVHLPSTARKPALVQAYEDNIRANADDLRAARNRDFNVLPDGREIVFLRNGQVQRSPSVSRAEEQSDVDDDSLAVERARGRRSVSWAESVPSSDEESRGNMTAAANASADVSAFSMDNPFQSHSNSPTGGTSSSSRITKSRASEPAKQKPVGAATKKRANTSARRSLPQSIKRMSADVNEAANESGEADSSQSSIFSPLVQKQKRIRQWVDHANDEESDKESDAQQHDDGSIGGLLSFLVVLSATIWWSWYTRESRAIGFCDSGRSTNALLDQRAVDSAAAQIEQQHLEGLQAVLAHVRLPDILRPSCTSCPAHAECAAGALAGCESDDYVLRRPLLSYVPIVRSALPLVSVAPHCEPDEEKLLLAADLADEIESKLRHWKADVYCNRQRARLGPRDEPDWGAQGVYALPTSDIYHDLQTAAMRGNVLRSHSDDFFRQLWDLAMADLDVSQRVEQRSSRLLAMRGPLGVGVRCRLGLATSSVWQRSRVWLAVVVCSLAVVQWLRLRLRDTFQSQRRARELVEIALDRLQAAKRRHVLLLSSGNNSSSSPSGSIGGEAYYSITQLRDSVLQRETNQRLRKDLWARVSKLVEANTNVRTRQGKVHGEWTKVWEWVGPVQDERNGFEEMQQQYKRRSTIMSGYSDVPEDIDPTRFRWGGDDDAQPEKQLDPNDYNASQDRRPSAEI